MAWRDQLRGSADYLVQVLTQRDDAAPAELPDLRAAVDAMEIIVEREAWPVPTYNEILFYA